MIDKKFKSYVEAMMNASDKIISENPAHLVVPMMGSVPFVDIMSLVNRDFDPSIAVYMPASSGILNVKNVLKEWYGNFLDDVVKVSEPLPKILGIDEVVSGQSLVRCVKCIDVATNKKRRFMEDRLMDRIFSTNIEDVQNGLYQISEIVSNNEDAYDIVSIVQNRNRGLYEKMTTLRKNDFIKTKNILRKSLVDKLNYRSIGIEEDRNTHRCKTYSLLKNNGRVVPVSVDKILTMDKPDLCAAKYKFIEDYGDFLKMRNVLFSPEISGFEITPKYVKFLQDIARYVGANPRNVTPVNMGAILESSKYLNTNV